MSWKMHLVPLVVSPLGEMESRGKAGVSACEAGACAVDHLIDHFQLSNSNFFIFRFLDV